MLTAILAGGKYINESGGASWQCPFNRNVKHAPKTLQSYTDTFCMKQMKAPRRMKITQQETNINSDDIEGPQF